MHPELIAGCDFSLKATGLATHQGVKLIKTKAPTKTKVNDGDCINRARIIARETHAATGLHNLTVRGEGLTRKRRKPVIYLEAPIHYRFPQLDLHQGLGAFRGGLAGLRNIVLVKPATIKRYATGHGQANKAAIIGAAQDLLGYTGNSDDEADALWLRQIGLAIHGLSDLELPDNHTEALQVFATDGT